MTTDRINYTVNRLGDNDPCKTGVGKRFEIRLTNLTEPEAAEVLVVLARLQREREQTKG